MGGRIKSLFALLASAFRLLASTHPIQLYCRLSRSCVAATSWLPATCEFPSTLPSRGGSTVPVSRPIAYALPVPLSLCRIGSFLRQAEHVSPAVYCSPRCFGGSQVCTPDGVWWMVRDSNPRWCGVPTFSIYCLVHSPLTGAFDLSAQPSLINSWYLIRFLVKTCELRSGQEVSNSLKFQSNTHYKLN